MWITTLRFALSRESYYDGGKEGWLGSEIKGFFGAGSAGGLTYGARRVVFGIDRFWRYGT